VVRELPVGGARALVMHRFYCRPNLLLQKDLFICNLLQCKFEKIPWNDVLSIFHSPTMGWTLSLVQPPRENLGIGPKAPFFVQPRSETFWNCDQKHCILFSHAAKN
jgi:hypothetical protein